MQLLIHCINSANAANQRGDYQAAADWCQQALRLTEDVPEVWFNLGVALGGLGRRAEGMQALHQARIRTLAAADAQNSIGLAFLELGAFQEADLCLSRALALEPNFAYAHSNLGRLRQCQGRLDEAKLAARQAVELQPDLVAAHVNLGAILNAKRDFQSAEAACRTAVKLAPGLAAAWSNLGAALLGLRRYDEAEKACHKATELAPDFADAWCNYGGVLDETKRYEDAERAFRRATDLAPRSSDAWSCLASALSGLQRHEEAEAACRKALQIAPESMQAWCNLANALNGQRRSQEAEAAGRQAVKLEPDSGRAWNNLAVALMSMERYDEADSAGRMAIEHAPDHPGGWVTLGEVRSRANKLDPATECFSRALDIDSTWPDLRGRLLHAKMQMCAWQTFDQELRALIDEVHQGRQASEPFCLLGLTTDPYIHRKGAETFARRSYAEKPVLAPIPRRLRRDKIRLGYYSADFRNHPVSFLIAEAIELHDRSRFDLTGFSFGPESRDDTRARMSVAFDRFIDVKALSDREIAEMSRELEIDIAIDLGGFTEHSRTNVFAYRAAPVQASYLGYLGTMGVPYMDYLLADQVIVPPGSEHYYAARLVRLPSYQANDSKRRIADRIYTREELGLPAEGFVYCCFNNTYKITPEMFSGWMRILSRVEGSVLILLANDEAARNLRLEAVRRGIDPARLVFAGRLPPADYMARFKTVDLFLDTLPYNAGTTASDALWAGLPVLTQQGRAFAGRVAASVLTAIGLPELITTTQQEYEDLAVDLALKPMCLRAIRDKLERNRTTTLLFDTPRFTRNLERAFKVMYERHVTGLPPDHVMVN